MSSVKFFVMVKPDGVRRGLIGDIIKRFEARGFKLYNIGIRKPGRDIVESHYEEHKGKGFFERLVSFTCSGEVIPMIWEGNIQVARMVVGETIPWESKQGTIRGDCSCSIQENLVHCSDSAESAQREIDLWFPKNEKNTTQSKKQ